MITFVHRFIVPAAYSLLPPEMASDKATAMLLATGLQESKFEHRRQINGPAKSFHQFEMGGGVKGISTHRATKDHLEQCLEALRYHHPLSNWNATHAAMEHNDVLACICARLLLWTLPAALPDAHHPEIGWQQYIEAWRPGKPHPDDWAENFSRAWMLVQNP